MREECEEVSCVRVGHSRITAYSLVVSLYALTETTMKLLSHYMHIVVSLKVGANLVIQISYLSG